MLSEAKHPATSTAVEFQLIPKVSTAATFEKVLGLEVAGFFPSLRMTFLRKLLDLTK
jgi:hypothetical protein